MQSQLAILRVDSLLHNSARKSQILKSKKLKPKKSLLRKNATNSKPRWTRRTRLSQNLKVKLRMTLNKKPRRERRTIKSINNGKKVRENVQMKLKLRSRKSMQKFRKFGMNSTLNPINIGIKNTNQTSQNGSTEFRKEKLKILKETNAEQPMSKRKRKDKKKNR